MKFRIMFKDPDGVYECVRYAIETSFSYEELRLPTDEREELFGLRREKVESSLREWIQYNEYLTVEFDTVTGTAEVIKIG